MLPKREYIRHLQGSASSWTCMGCMLYMQCVYYPVYSYATTILYRSVQQDLKKILYPTLVPNSSTDYSLACPQARSRVGVDKRQNKKKDNAMLI
jgi:hypothetical protein